MLIKTVIIINISDSLWHRTRVQQRSPKDVCWFSITAHSRNKKLYISEIVTFFYASLLAALALKATDTWSFGARASYGPFWRSPGDGKIKKIYLNKMMEVFFLILVGSILLLSAEKAYQKINCLWPNLHYLSKYPLVHRTRCSKRQGDLIFVW